MSALATIRKAVASGAGVLVTGAYTVAQADGFDVTRVTEGQVSSVLFGALATAVGVFAVKNAKAKAILGDAEQAAADLGAKAITGHVIPFLTSTFAPALDDLAAAVAAALPALPEPPPEDPPAAEVGAVDINDDSLPTTGAHAAPDTLEV